MIEFPESPPEPWERLRESHGPLMNTWTIVDTSKKPWETVCAGIGKNDAVKISLIPVFEYVVRKMVEEGAHGFRCSTHRGLRDSCDCILKEARALLGKLDKVP